MKTLLFVLICASAGHAQTVSVFAGGGAGTFNNAWKDAAPVFAAGFLIDNKIGDRAGTEIGLSYRQRARRNPDTRISAVQFDISGRYDFGRFAAGAGFFFALTAGSDSDVEPAESHTSGTGATAFFAWDIFERFGLRLVYDHGLGNLSEVGEVRPQAAYLVAAYRIGGE